MTLKEGIGCTGIELWWYPRKEFADLTEKQKDELREFTNLAAGGKQKVARVWPKTQEEGHPNKKQKTNSNISSGSISKQQATQIAATVVKLGKKKKKETSKFNKGMEKISALLVNSSMLAQVGGIEVEVN